VLRELQEAQDAAAEAQAGEGVDEHEDGGESGELRT